MATIARLTEINLSDCVNVFRGSTGRPALKSVPTTALSNDALGRLTELKELRGEDEIGVGTREELLEITYCHRLRSSERIWAYMGNDCCFFPLWWDPDHVACGHSEPHPNAQRHPCDVGCLHPPFPAA